MGRPAASCGRIEGFAHPDLVVLSAAFARMAWPSADHLHGSGFGQSFGLPSPKMRQETAIICIFGSRRDIHGTSPFAGASRPINVPEVRCHLAASAGDEQATKHKV